MRRIWHWLFDEKPFGCDCGKRFRDENGLSRHVWRHEGFG